MTKAQYQKAYERDQRRKQAQRAERLVMSDYPGDHNPYIPHRLTETCYAGCVHEGGLNGGESNAAVWTVPDSLSRKTYDEAERAFNNGFVSDSEWVAYRCAWRNSTVRFSSVASEHEGHEPGRCS